MISFTEAVLDTVVDQAHDAIRSANQEDRLLARLLVIDTLACAASSAGRHANVPNVTLATLLADVGPVRDAMLTPAALATLAHFQEFDALHAQTASTPSMIVAAVLHDARSTDAALRDVLEAVLFGLEVDLRFGTALQSARLYTRGIWPASIVSKLGAAAARARLRGLTRQQTTEALALAATWGPTLLPRTITDAHYLSAGFSASQAAKAVEYAATGTVGARSILADDVHVGSACILQDAQKLWSSLGMQIFKLYPCARPLHAMIEAITELAPRIANEDLRGLTVTLPSPVRPFLNNDPKPADIAERRCSTWYVAGLAAIGRASDPTAYEEPVDDGLPPNVTVHFDDVEVNRAYPQTWDCIVEATTAHGSSVVRGTAADTRVEEVGKSPALLQPLLLKWRALSASSDWIDRWLDSDVGARLTDDLLPRELLGVTA